MRTTIALIVLGMGGLALFSRPPDMPFRAEHQAPLLPRLEVLKAAGSFSVPLLADYFWIQTIQAIGRARTADEYRDAYFYADLCTTLDPDFAEVYAFAGAAIPFNHGRERWVNTRESTTLLEKGHRRYPNFILLNVLLAYNLSYFHERHRDAAKLLQKTSQLPGAPSHLGPLATRLFTQAGDFASGEALATALLDGSPPELRGEFEQRVLEIRLERVLSGIEEAARRFKERRGDFPRSISELLEAGELSQAPTCPLGGELMLSATGTASSTVQQRRLRTFEFIKDTAQQ